MLEALVAATCMFVVNILGTITVIAEAARRAWLAAWVYTVAWLPSIIATTIAVETLNGRGLIVKGAVVGLVSLANLLGTVTGTWLGNWLLGQRKVRQLLKLGPRGGE
jgi:hypothetical protein